VEFDVMCCKQNALRFDGTGPAWFFDPQAHNNFLGYCFVLPFLHGIAKYSHNKGDDQVNNTKRNEKPKVVFRLRINVTATDR
jgi:hypothetical protein